MNSKIFLNCGETFVEKVMYYRLVVAKLLIFLVNKLLQRYFLMIRLKERIFTRTLQEERDTVSYFSLKINNENARQKQSTESV